MGRVTNTRIAATASTLVAAGLAALALRPSAAPPTPVAAARQRPDVRTEIIRRTVYVVRRERPAKRPPARVARVGATAAGGTHAVVAGSGVLATHTSPHRAGTGTVAASSSATTVAAAPVTTHTSGKHSSAAAATTTPASGTASTPAVTTHSSGTKTSSAAAATTPKVTTHTSGSKTAGGGTVRSRTSGHGDDGGHDD